jgi:hypothetical protein
MKKLLTINVGLNAKRETNNGYVRSEILESVQRLNHDSDLHIWDWRLANAPNGGVWTDAGVLVVQVCTIYTDAYLLQRLVNLCDLFQEDAIAYTLADESGNVYCKNLAYRSDYTSRYLFSDKLFINL